MRIYRNGKKCYFCNTPKISVLMKGKNSYFERIVPHVEKRYGKEMADSIMQKAWKRFEELCEENVDEPKSHYIHTRERIYPGIAMFDAMTAEGIGREDTIFSRHFSRHRRRSWFSSGGYNTAGSGGFRWAPVGSGGLRWAPG